MNLIKKILPPLFSIFVLFILFINRVVPSGVLWKDYSLFYVPVDTPEEIVLNTFAQNKVDKVICLSNQLSPISISSQTPQSAMFFLSSKTNSEEGEGYLKNRENYFFDKNREVKIYYIPQEYKNKLKDCAVDLEHQKIKAGVDSKAVYPWILPVLCFILFVILIIFAKNKLLYGLISIFPLMFIYSNPFYPAAMATTLTLFVSFCATNLWKRKGALSILKSNYILLGVCVIAILAAFAGSLISGAFFILVIAGMASVVFAYNEYEEYLLKKTVFKYVFIRPARMISVFAERAKLVLSSMVTVQILVIAAFFASSALTVKSNFNQLLLPAANVMTYERDESLPELEEYYRWNWKIYTYPYLSLNKMYEKEYNEISYPKYVEQDGKLVKVDVQLTYNDSFKENINDDIDNLSYNSIESVLKAQKSDLKPGFSSFKSNSISLFGIIMMIVSLLMLLFIYFSVIMKRNRTGGKK